VRFVRRFSDDKPEEVKSATSNKINTPTEEQK
jgi:hypothetical protein